MIARAAINPGRIFWTGENHCLYLEAGPTGPWTAAFTTFHVKHSPHGSGSGVFALSNPQASGPDQGNLCLSDNEPLFRWLAEQIVSHYGAFKDRPAFRHLAHVPLSSFRQERPRHDAFRESFTSGGRHVTLEWLDLEEPVFLELPPEKTSTRKHEVFGSYVTARAASASIDGRALPGSVFAKPFLGRETTTAYLIFSETWVDTAPGR